MSARFTAIVRSRALVLLSALVALGAAIPSVARAGECPNEQVRHESNISPSTEQPYSTQLPDCRAYELVSPPNSGGYPAASAGQVGAQEAGEGSRLDQVTSHGAVFFMSEMAPPETGAIPNGRGPGVFVSTRGSAGWSTTDLTPFSSPAPDDLIAGSLDGTSALIFTDASLLPADQDNPRNEFEDPNAGDLYVVHGSKRAPELVSKGTLAREPNANEAILSPFVFNSDLSAVAFLSNTPLVAEANAAATDCYSWTDVGQRIAGLVNPDQGTTRNCSLRGMTPEGRAVFVDESGDADNGALLVSGAGASVDPVWISGASPFAATYDGVSPNDRLAYVTTTDQLQEAPNASGPSNIYAVDVPEFPPQALPSPPTPSSVTCVSCAHNGTGVTFLGQSADGSHVYFSSSEGLWSWNAVTGETSELASATDVSQLDSSENGQYVIGLTSQLAGNPNSTADVYEFTAGRAPQLITSGDSADAYSTVGVSNNGLRVVYNHVSAGEVSPEVIDEWSSGATHQISPLGSAYQYAAIGTAGPELDDVFLEAHEPLVAQDLNAGTADIYDARVDGGLPAPSTPLSESTTPNPIAPAAPSYATNLQPPNLQPAELPADTSHPASAPAGKPLTKAQRLAKALKACKKDRSMSKRLACDKAAHRKYGSTKKAAK